MVRGIGFGPTSTSQEAVLAALPAGFVTFDDYDRLVEFADFETTYLDQVGPLLASVSHPLAVPSNSVSALSRNSRGVCIMCWSASVSVAMVAVGGAAVAVTVMRGEPKAIWITLGFFTLMEGLQAAGYAVVDECSNPANISITTLSYLHIAIQPLFINAFAMAIAPAAVPDWQRRSVYGLAAIATGFMLLKLVPLEAFGDCTPGSPMCAQQTCLISGDWHIGWILPLNGLMEWGGSYLPINFYFPAYFLAVFALPLWYGAWRFALFHLLMGPFMAFMLTTNLNEQPAIWCLFSIGIIVISLSSFIRVRVMGAHQPA